MSTTQLDHLVDAAPAGTPRRGRWIDVWDPEDQEFWRLRGRAIAVRNLVFSVFAEHLAFSLWGIWSVIVIGLPAAGFSFGVDRLFWLTALPTLLGSALRLPYTFAVPRFGGRNWTVVSGLLLLIPCGLMTYCVSAHAPFWLFLVAAATAGLGGGNFASSMAHISYFFPESRKGLALGLNAAGGNLGVAAVQLIVPVAISWGTGMHLSYAGLVYLPLIVLSAVLAAAYMDNLTDAKSDFAAQAAAGRRGVTWVLSFLYIGTFGSFIGYSFALPLLIKTQFPEVHAASFAWVGALVGSLSRPAGGWLADRLGGRLVTLWTFATMGGAAGLVLLGERTHHFGLFFGGFLVLFITTGIGNGSVYQLIPGAFTALVGGVDRLGAKRETAAALGIASAIGALGGFFISRACAISIGHTGTADLAFCAFIGWYAVCFAVTWRAIAAPSRPALTAATADR